jgi:hypothetical protein
MNAEDRLTALASLRIENAILTYSDQNYYLTIMLSSTLRRLNKL